MIAWPEIFSEHLFSNFIFARYSGQAWSRLTEEECTKRIVLQTSIVIVLSIWWIIQLQKIRWLKWKKSSNVPVKIRLIKWLKNTCPRFQTRHKRCKMPKDFQAWLKLFVSPWGSKMVGLMQIQKANMLRLAQSRDVGWIWAGVMWWRRRWIGDWWCSGRSGVSHGERTHQEVDSTQKVLWAQVITSPVSNGFATQPDRWYRCISTLLSWYWAHSSCWLFLLDLYW